MKKVPARPAPKRVANATRNKAAASKGPSSRPAARKPASRKPPARKPASRRPSRPVYPPTPVDEMCGILLIAVGIVIGLLAVKPSWMGSLEPLGELLGYTLGHCFLVAAAFVVLLGIEAFIPHQALALPQLLTALAGLFLCLEAIADLSGGRGGTVGASIGDVLRSAVGRPGAWTMTIAFLLVDLQWITRISLRGPARLLTWPARLLWRMLRAMGRGLGTAWRSYQQRRADAEAARPLPDASKPTTNGKSAGAKSDPTNSDTAPEAPIFPDYPTAADPEAVPEPQPDVSAKKRRSKKTDAVEAQVNDGPVFPEYPLAGASDDDEPVEAAVSEAPEFDDWDEDADEAEIPGYEDNPAPRQEATGPVSAEAIEVDNPAAAAELDDDVPPWIDPSDEVKPTEEDEDLPWDEAVRGEQIPLFGPEATRPPVQYDLPPMDLLQAAGATNAESAGGDLSRLIVETLNSFGVATRIVNVEKGPTVTRYELQPARGVKVSRITSLNNDIALALAAQSIRIEAPIPGKSAIGIEVPNSRVDAVPLREILESQGFSNGKGLMLALGKDISGRSVVADLLRMPHLLIAGATGSGKSVCLNTVIVSILYRATPREVQMVMVDPKRVELSIFEGIPHLADTNANPNGRIIKDAKTGTLVLKQACEIMNQRFELLSQSRVRNIGEYNAKAAVPMPYLVIIVDELAQLMQISARSVEGYLQELAQMGRAAGIHLILATQRPSVDVLTGTIKSNFPARIAFAVSAQVDSRTILDRGGAEKLLGRGDMLFSPTDAELRRVQGALITLEETERVVNFWRAQEPPENVTPLSLEAKSPEELLAQGGAEGEDEDLLREAIRIIRDTRLASASNLQRKLMIGYPRAARLVDELESRGFLGPANGSKPRKILFLDAEA